jgi:hypothetical protein
MRRSNSENETNLGELLEQLELEVHGAFSSAPSVRGDLLSELYYIGTCRVYRLAIIDVENPERSIRIWLKKRLRISLMCVQLEASLSSEWVDGLGD